MTNNALLKSISLEALLGARAAARERMLAIANSYDELRQVLEPWGSYCAPSLHVSGRIGRLDVRSGVDEVLQSIDGRLWRYLFEHSGLLGLMDHKAKAKWREDIDRGAFPELTAENVASTLAELHDGRREMFERGVVEVFRSLNGRLKTNRKAAYGKKQIVSGFTDRFGMPERLGTERLDDLVRVFAVLDGAPEPARDQQSYALLGKASQAGECEYTTPYVRVKWFRNGNAHVWFLRPDLLDQVNAILARHLPFHLGA